MHELVAFDTLDEVHKEEDAFSMSWKAVLRSLCARCLFVS